MKQHIQVPTCAHKDDKEWLESQLMRLSAGSRQKAMDAYTRVFNDAYAAEINELKKENAARYAANVRLRSYIDRLHKNHQR